jgi:hypothetical protein
MPSLDSLPTTESLQPFPAMANGIKACHAPAVVVGLSDAERTSLAGKRIAVFGAAEVGRVALI